MAAFQRVYHPDFFNDLQLILANPSWTEKQQHYARAKAHEILQAISEHPFSNFSDTSDEPLSGAPAEVQVTFNALLGPKRILRKSRESR